jgi:NAD(P)-dependent dehydrogenase (short-subunit alcohol dehydrogenase family)
MVKLLSQELWDEGIRVNGVCPGVIKTDFAKAIIGGRDPRSVGTPKNISDFVAVACSEDGRFMNGELIVIDGGSKL